MPTLRPYQLDLEQRIEQSWQRNNRVVMAISPTGSGKTVLFSNILMRETGASAAIAHRKELVGQMSLALARNGVRHRVIGPDTLRREIVSIHMGELRRSYYDPNARCGVVGIDSLVNLNPSDPWLGQVRRWIGDEGHHFLRENKWGRGVAMMPNATGLLVTATGFRADGKGLGRGILLPDGKYSNDGLADDMVLGPSPRDLINKGYLTDYRLVAPPSDVDYSDVTITASGDLSPQKLRAAVHRSTRFVGDIVRTYEKFTPGKLAVCFAVDVEEAGKIARKFRESGITAEVVSATTPETLRTSVIRRFRNREIQVLVNVDLFGEGFDLPAVEVVIMARKTESKGLFDQMFGRVLRVLVDECYAKQWDQYTDLERLAIIASSSKPFGWIIDHVGNVERHLPPDAPRYHTLERADRRASTPKGDVIPLRRCLNPECWHEFERVLKICPYCKTKVVVTGRATPEMVDGDLVEVAPEILRAMRGEVAKIDGPCRPPSNVDINTRISINNRHYERQHAQKELRESMALWAGGQRHVGREDSEIYRRFYFAFGLDMLTAAALGRPDAEALKIRIDERTALDGFVKAE